MSLGGLKRCDVPGFADAEPGFVGPVGVADVGLGVELGHGGVVGGPVGLAPGGPGRDDYMGSGGIVAELMLGISTEMKFVKPLAAYTADSWFS